MSGEGFPVRRVVIAGGGTAGWLAAAALSRQLGPLIELTLIESEEIGTVGVGEATIPTARTFHALAGVDEAAFMRAAGATFKLAIRFEDWARVGDSYLHSFGTIGKSTWMGDFQHMWLRARALGVAGPLSDYSLESRAAVAERFAAGEYAALSYAYHLDAGGYARHLRELSEARGTRRIEGRIASVERDGESGHIAALLLASGERVEGDLFLDCTGFRGLLIEEALGAGFEDWSHWLPTDRALAVQTRATRAPRPYTRAIAHDAGWRWEIPLQHRVGNGLVYASAHLDDDAARARLVAGVEGDPITEPRLIRYRTGRRRAAWVGNCVALGLATGFVEPLESTSIHLIMTGVSRLIQAFPAQGFSAAAIARYNAQARRELEGVRDFIILHYHLNARDDGDFWPAMRGMAVPDSLAERIALFREAGQAYQAGDELFRVDSWVQVMLGQGICPQRCHPMGALLNAEQLRGALADLSGNIARAVERLPSHEAFLARHCAATARSDAA